MVTIYDVDNARDPENFMEVFEVDLFDDYYNRGSPMAGLPLRIVQSTGVTVEKDFNVKVTDLNSDADNRRFKQFTNNGDGGVSFSCRASCHPARLRGLRAALGSPPH